MCLQWRSCRRHGFNPWVRKVPWKRAWQPTPVFLPGESHGQVSLVGYSPYSHKESSTTEVIYHTRMLLSLVGFLDGSAVKNLPANARDAGLIPGLGRSPGEGNGTQLQYSCLGNSMDRRAWRATYSPWGHRELDTTEQAGFRKGRGTRDQICQPPLDHGKSKSSRKTSILALLTMPKPLTVWITINCGKFWKR